MQRYIPLIGWIGFAFGLITAIFATLPGWWQMVALFSMLPGFLCSSLYILYSTRYRITSGWINPGYTGMFLSSAPLIMILYFHFTK